MFNYVDPAGRNFLSNAAVATEFRRTMQGLYDNFARISNSAFTWIEAFGALSGGQTPGQANVDWRAFPLNSNTTDKNVDAKRFEIQEEYVEWRVEKSGTKVSKVTFTTEFPEYLQAFAAIGFADLKAAIADIVPGADPTEAELFGPGFSSAASTGTARSLQFRRNLRNNPWNNGKKGILCLTQGANTLVALFQLLVDCGIPHGNGGPEATCGLVNGSCVEGRASDPVVCTTAQTAVRGGLGFTPRDPAGIRMASLEGVWKVGGVVIKINDPADNRGAWVLDRNGRRGILRNITGLTLDDKPIETGAQVSKKLKVTVDLLTAPDAALPDWARIRNESSSRGPT